MARLNPLNVLNLLRDLYSGETLSPVTERERKCAVDFKEFLDGALKSGNPIIETEVDLHFRDEEDYVADIEDYDLATASDFEDDDEPHSSQLPSSGSTYSETPPTKRGRSSGPDYSYKKKAVDYFRSGKTGNLKLESVQKRFRLVKDSKMLSRWAKDVDEGGSTTDKLAAIYNRLLAKFIDAKKNRIILHDINLRRWALEINADVKLDGFKASEWFVRQFKNKFRIVSRKITKFVTRKYLEERENLEDEAAEFVQNVAERVIDLPDYGCLKNSDQSGFQREMHTGRTLDWKGVKNVEALVQSLSATSHSYTIQPTITAAGCLLKPLFICLQEPSGNFGPIVDERLNDVRCSEVYLTASKSGKLTKDILVKKWFAEVFHAESNTSRSSLLLLDSFPAHKDATALKAVTPEGKNTVVCIIPAGTTGIIQPLDVYFFRLYKEFFRTIWDYVIMRVWELGLEDRDEIQMFQRNSIVRLQAILHHQFRSPRFSDMIRYSFFKCGYIPDRPPEFVTPSEFCFDDPSFDDFCSCGKIFFLTCGWCRQTLCFSCLFDKYHLCEQFVL